MNSKVCPCPNDQHVENMGCNVLNTALPNPQSKVPTLIDQAQQTLQNGSKMSHLSANINGNNGVFVPNQDILGNQSKNLDALSKRTGINEGNMQGLMSKASVGV